MIVNKKDFSRQSFWIIFLVSDASYIIRLFHVCFISLAKSVYNGFKTTIHKSFIQIKITIKMNISIKCLFLDAVSPITHQTLQIQCTDSTEKR